VPNPNPFGTPLLVAPDPQTLRQIAQVSGGKAFTAEDSDSLKSIYKTLGSQLGTKTQKKQITATFAIGGLVLLLGAAFSSLRWAGRLP
jgi:Ca-activated chloride channel family protein